MPEKYRDLVLKEKIQNDFEKGKETFLPAFELPEKDFKNMWDKIIKNHEEELKSKSEEDKKYATSLEYELANLAEHPNMTEDTLRKILNWKNRPGSNGSKEISAISSAKKAAYDQLDKKGSISNEEKVKMVKEKLGFDGDTEILKLMAEKAFLSPPETINKNTFNKISDSELENIKKEFAKTSVHNDKFNYDIVGAWEITEPVHNKYEDTSKKIDNVKSKIYHGTSYANAAGILNSGIRIGEEERTGSMFGEGFYLASNSSKAMQYASDNFSDKGGEGIIFECDVSLGNSQEMKYGRPEADDLSHTQNESDKKWKEQQKKEGKPFSTKWHQTNDSVTAKAGMALDYDEYVVKDPQQVKVRKVIRVVKTPKVG